MEVANGSWHKAGDEDYGVLTLLLQLDYEPREWFKFRQAVFSRRRTWIRPCVVLNAAPQPLLPENQRILL